MNREQIEALLLIAAEQGLEEALVAYDAMEDQMLCEECAIYESGLAQNSNPENWN